MMNKRSKDLIPKPWTFPYPDREMYSKEQMEHLINVVIRECVQVCLDHHDPSNLNYSPSLKAADAISDRFGFKR